MSDKIQEKATEMVDKFVDTGIDTTTTWGNNYIKENLPKALDKMATGFIGCILALKEKDDSQFEKALNELCQKTLAVGIEIGEDNKERSLTKAMADEGLNQEQIDRISRNSAQYLVPTDGLFEMEKKPT